jgi:hypothetical protein
MDLHFQAANVAYVLESDDARPRDKPMFAQDNMTICAILSRTIDPANIRSARQFNSDARGMWGSLKDAHQDTLSGGRMVWIWKLIGARMSDDDVKCHIDEMALHAQNLESFISKENPLSVDDIHSAALLASLPSDWLSCVSALINEERVPSIRNIVAALKHESLRRKSRQDMSTVSPSVTPPRYNALNSFCPQSGGPPCSLSCLSHKNTKLAESSRPNQP